MKIRGVAQRLIDGIFAVVESLCRLILLFMATVVTAQVVFRAFNSNIKWCEEVMLILLVCLMLLTMVVGIKEDIHIRIEVFAKHFPRKVRVALVYFSHLIMLLVSTCMVYYGYILMNSTKSVFNVTGLPRKYLYLFTVISGALAIVVLVAKLFGMYETESTVNFIEGHEADPDIMGKGGEGNG